MQRSIKAVNALNVSVMAIATGTIMDDGYRLKVDSVLA